MADRCIRVLCVDDDPRLTAAWERFVQLQPDMEPAGTLSGADDLIATVRRTRADIVLIDMTMGGRDPLDALAELSRECPEARAIVFSGLNDDATIRRAIDAGAWGFLDKLEAPTTILDAVRSVANGEVVLPRGFPA